MAKSFFNKKGQVFVEGAIGLPIIILTAVSFIMALVFFYNAFLTQCKVQDKLLQEAATKEHIYRKVSAEGETSSHIGGMAERLFSEKYRGEITVIDEAELIRLGGIFHDE